MNSSSRKFKQSSPIFISMDDLPLSCPRPGQPLWNAHPKVYLPIEDTGREVCPYCGAEYILSDPH